MPPFISWAKTPRATLLLIVLLAFVRLLYLFFYCPYNLIEDEAHYWEWSRHLDWSYYSKGPGVAWTIFASTSLLGQTEFAVRITAPLFAALTMFALARLARDISGDWRAGFITAVLVACAPAMQMTGLLFTIDGPYCACWALCCLAAYHALFRGSLRAWPALGLFFAFGFIYKYTILLLLPGIILFALFNRRSLVLHAASRLLIPLAALIAALGLAPIVIWNSQHNWVTIHHLLGHLGVQGGDTTVTQGTSGYHYSPQWTLDFFAAQIAFLGGGCVAVGAAIIAWFRTRKTQPSPAHTFLLSLAAPILIFYVIVSFITEPEGNWAIGGFMSLFVIAALWLLPRLDAYRLNPAANSPAHGFWKAALVVGIVSGIIMLRLDSVDSILACVHVPENIRRGIPMSRLSGAPEQAAHVDRLIDDLRKRTGKEPFVIAQHYGRASQLAFYLRSQPRGVVFCASAYTGGRTSQYDLWDEASLRNPDLRGRPAVLVGGDESGSIWTSAFEKVVPIGTLDGDRKRNRPAFTGSGYYGW